MAGKGGLAEEIRAGLETQEPQAPAPVQRDALDELYFRKPIRRHVQEFSCVLAIIALGIGGFIAWRGNVATPLALLATALLTVAIGYTRPQLMHPVWKAFLEVGHFLGTIVTYVILTLSWTVVLLPTALVMRIIGKAVMNTSFRTAAASYWEERDPKLGDFKLLERQY